MAPRCKDPDTTKVNLQYLVIKFDIVNNYICIIYSFILQTKTPSLLQLSLKRHTETAVRSAVYAHRIAEQLRKALTGTDEEGSSPTFLLVMCNGYFSTTAGEGPMYKRFLRKKKIGKYIGRNVKARTDKDPDYTKSRLRIMSFDRAFIHCNTDAQDRKCV